MAVRDGADPGIMLRIKGGELRSEFREAKDGLGDHVPASP